MSVERVENSLWHERVPAVPVCVLPWTSDEFAAKWNIAFDEFADDGLGLCRTAVVRLGPCLCLAQAHPSGPGDAAWVSLSVPGTSPDTQRDLSDLLQALAITQSRLRWVSPLLGPAPWSLYRLDDNGNEFLIERHQRREWADRVRDEYEAKGHKQLYFVRPSSERGPKSD